MNKDMCMYEDHYFNHKTNKWEKNTIQKRVCIDKNCTRRHKLKRSDKICPLNIKCPDIGTTCFLLHDLDKIVQMCKYGRNCCDLKCEYRHPLERQTQICPKNISCPDALITCFLLHDVSNIIPLCRYNKNCINFMCEKRHSTERIPPCPDGSMCYNYILSVSPGTGKKSPVCPYLHPKILQKLCKWDLHSECRTYGCSFIHKPNSAKDCPNGMQCQYRICEDERLRCTDKHPKFYKVTQIGEKLFFE